MSTIGVASPRVFKAAWGHGKNDNCMSKQSSRTSHFRCRVRTGVFAKASDASTDSTRNELTTELLQILGKGTEGSARMARTGDRMGSVPVDELPIPEALRRGGAEVTVGGLGVSGSGPATLSFDTSDGSFSTATERISVSSIVEIDSGTGDAVVMNRRTG